MTPNSSVTRDRENCACSSALGANPGTAAAGQFRWAVRPVPGAIQTPSCRLRAALASGCLEGGARCGWIGSKALQPPGLLGGPTAQAIGRLRASIRGHPDACRAASTTASPIEQEQELEEIPIADLGGAGSWEAPPLSEQAELAETAWLRRLGQNAICRGGPSQGGPVRLQGPGWGDSTGRQAWANSDWSVVRRCAGLNRTCPPPARTMP